MEQMGHVTQPAPEARALTQQEQAAQTLDEVDAA
jgi:hypothetical protein